MHPLLDWSRRWLSFLFDSVIIDILQLACLVFLALKFLSSCLQEGFKANQPQSSIWNSFLYSRGEKSFQEIIAILNIPTASSAFSSTSSVSSAVWTHSSSMLHRVLRQMFVVCTNWTIHQPWTYLFLFIVTFTFLSSFFLSLVLFFLLFIFGIVFHLW